MTFQEKQGSSEFEAIYPPTTVNRRGFLVTSLATGFAASVAPTRELMAQTISTSSDGLLAGTVEIPVKDGKMVAYRARPQGDRRVPVVLVIQEIFGVHEYIRDVCRRLAQQGYCAIAPELFARQGDPRQYTAIQDLFANIVAKVPDSQVLSDLDACVDWAGQEGADVSRLAVTGFCWGGRITWLYAAHQPKVKAGIAWYGRLTGEVNANNPKHPYDIAANLYGPVLGLYGAADTGIPVTTVEEMQTRLGFGNAAAQKSEFVVYPDAPHAFHADYRPSYRPEVARDAWGRALNWLKSHGV